MDAVTDFKSIRRKLERQDQKAEFEVKNPLLVWSDCQQAWVAPEHGYGNAGLNSIKINPRGARR